MTLLEAEKGSRMLKGSLGLLQNRSRARITIRLLWSAAIKVFRIAAFDPNEGG
jgi:hypothetical protein